MAEKRSRQRDEPGDRVSPHNLDAERAVLGAILVNNAAHERTAVWLRRGRVFFRKAHREIYAAILTVLEEHRAAVDLVTLREELARRGVLDEVGGVSYVAGLTDGIPRSANAGHYARIVHELAVRREVIRIGGQMVEDAHNGELTATEVVGRADKAIVDLARERVADRLIDLRADLGSLYEDFERRMALQGRITGVTSGIETLDQLTSGWQPGDLIVIGARPSMGKTAFVLNVVTAAARQGARALIFSLEMRTRQLQYRMVSQLSQVPLSRILGGYLTDEELGRIAEAFTALGTMRIHVDDRSGQTVHDIRATARQVRSDGGLDLVVIDYVQLITGSLDKRNATRREELDDISRRTKLLADELGVPVLLLSQLKRGDGSRRPRLEDLRETGALEQDADLVCFLHRRHHRVSGKTLIMLEKQRNGPTGTVQVTFDRDIQTFRDVGLEVTAEDVPDDEPEADSAPTRSRGRKLRPAAEVVGG